MNKTKTNLICAQCKLAHNSINGRYCNILHVYVEHQKNPICKYKINKNNENAYS